MPNLFCLEGGKTEVEFEQLVKRLATQACEAAFTRSADKAESEDLHVAD